jgi:glycosyltransferase involved in cell wall biosynthesis
MKSTLVIPAFNEAETIEAVVDQAIPLVDQVIVVDDGSDDDTSQRLQNSDALLISHEVNRGKAAALESGISHALSQGSEYIITLDGDGQHDPKEIPKLLESAGNNPATIVIAARLKEGHTAPKLRRFANRFADFWVSWASGYEVIDSQSGFRLYPAEIFRKIRLETNRERGFVFESEIIIEAANNKIYSISIPVDTIYRTEGRESHYKPWTDTWRIVRMIALRLLRRGMYPAGLLRSLHLLPDPRKRRPGG